LKVRFEANEIVSSLMLNIVALQAYRWIVTQGFNDPAAGFLATPALAAAARPPLLAGFSVLLLLIVLAPWAAGLLLNRSTVGYELRVVGDAPAFARQAGIPVARSIVLAMAIGGAFAGLAGWLLSHGLLGRLPADLPAGMGFEGLVVALLAANEPRRVPWAAFGYALLEGGAQAMERASDVPREMVLVIQALVVLAVVSVRLDPLAALRRAWTRLSQPQAAPAREVHP
jgi:simple sugar transport system permease protein